MHWSRDGRGWLDDAGGGTYLRISGTFQEPSSRSHQFPALWHNLHPRARTKAGNGSTCSCRSRRASRGEVSVSVFASARAQPHHRPPTGEMSRWSRRRAHGRLGRRARDILSMPASVGWGCLLTARRGPPHVTVLNTIQKWVYSRNTQATQDPSREPGPTPRDRRPRPHLHL